MEQRLFKVPIHQASFKKIIGSIISSYYSQILPLSLLLKVRCLELNKVINTLNVSTHPFRRYVLFSVLVNFLCTMNYLKTLNDNIYNF